MRSCPSGLADINYDTYRKLRFDPSRALWHGTGSRFRCSSSIAASCFTRRSTINEVIDGKSRPVRYSRTCSTSARSQALAGHDDLGFAGFRLHCPLNRPDYDDEICAFLGASYFRAVAKVRATACRRAGWRSSTADPTGEEFPCLKAFWLERPRRAPSRGDRRAARQPERRRRVPLHHPPRRRDDLRRRDRRSIRASTSRRPASRR